MEVVGGRHVDAEEVAPLADEDDHADAGREAQHHGVRNELDDAAEACQAEQQQNRSGHEGGELQTGDAVLGRNARQNDDESARRARDLYPAAAEHGHDERCHDGRVDALLRLRAGGDGKGHGQRQRDDADDHAGGQIGEPVAAAQQTTSMGFEQGDHSGRARKNRGASIPLPVPRPARYLPQPGLASGRLSVPQPPGPLPGRCPPPWRSRRRSSSRR